MRLPARGGRAYLAVLLSCALVVLSYGSTSAASLNFPQKGKPITIIVPYDPGGNNDISARMLAPLMEKDLGAPVEVVNKPGGGGQVGVTAVALAKPDGYTIASIPIPTLSIFALDPERKAAFTRKSFTPIATQVFSPTVLTVKKDSPFKDLKGLIDAAKANPHKIKAGASGFAGTRHFAILQLQQVTGARFAIAVFGGDAPNVTAVLGGHIDVSFAAEVAPWSQVKDGALRAIAVMDTQQSKSYPGVRTMEEQGFKIEKPFYMTMVGYAVPAGTPKEIAQRLEQSIKKAMDSDEMKTKAERAGLTLRYLTGEQTDEVLAKIEPDVPEMLKLARESGK